VAALRRVMDVSLGGYEAWRKREPSAGTREDEQLTARIITLHQAELVARGLTRGRNRVAWLMRQAGFAGVIGAK
jgi:hypothetical protein